MNSLLYIFDEKCREKEGKIWKNIQKKAGSQSGDAKVKSRYENSQELTQYSPRSHPRHLVGEGIAQSKTSHTGGHRLA